MQSVNLDHSQANNPDARLSHLDGQPGESINFIQLAGYGLLKTNLNPKLRYVIRLIGVIIGLVASWLNAIYIINYMKIRNKFGAYSGSSTEVVWCTDGSESKEASNLGFAIIGVIFETIYMIFFMYKQSWIIKPGSVTIFGKTDDEMVSYLIKMTYFVWYIRTHGKLGISVECDTFYFPEFLGLSSISLILYMVLSCVKIDCIQSKRTKLLMLHLCLIYPVFTIGFLASNRNNLIFDPLLHLFNIIDIISFIP